ncbi:MAG: VWA domain-containing protein [Vicinamibacterales bacterium]|nr:VWA domain-containing protein [Vicinamibacterales bacterium]
MSQLARAFGIFVLSTSALAAQGQEAPIFKSAVERVALTAVVRDSRGKLVKNLTARDFELLDSGRSRPLIGVWSEPSPASVAVLMDSSGSMATKKERAHFVAESFIEGLQLGLDEVALYAFDTTLQEVQPFTKKLWTTSGAWKSTRTFGETSLWDAIAATARRISGRQQRRALLVITDGVDSASELRPEEVSAIASELDVPVYVLVIGFLQDDGSGEPLPVKGPLADLAAWTGGDSLLIQDTPSAITATRQILTELQHQYVIAFEPGNAPGWHPLVLKTRKNGLVVRARSGYVVRALDK